MTADAVEITRRIAASPETVFAYFTDPERYRRWQGVDAELDPRPGGVFKVTVSGRSRAVARGRFVTVDPPTTIVFTWGWDPIESALPGMPEVPPGSSRVEVTLTPDGDGTLMRLRHTGLPTAVARDFHAGGWTLSVDRLVLAAAGSDPGPNPWEDL